MTTSQQTIADDGDYDCDDGDDIISDLVNDVGFLRLRVEQLEIEVASLNNEVNALRMGQGQR